MRCNLTGNAESVAQVVRARMDREDRDRVAQTECDRVVPYRVDLDRVAPLPVAAGPDREADDQVDPVSKPKLLMSG